MGQLFSVYRNPQRAAFAAARSVQSEDSHSLPQGPSFFLGLSGTVPRGFPYTHLGFPVQTTGDSGTGSWGFRYAYIRKQENKRTREQEIHMRSQESIRRRMWKLIMYITQLNQAVRLI